MSPSDLLIWLNIAVTVAGFAAIYVKIIERITQLEADSAHVMHKLKMSVRRGD